ncbi:hypothetical protein [Thalassovita mangrovi]|uniref:Uncharacterized protein n=1 Tax=Thalassovita mangrovi TaxID=2692236 RepID=A0A6L8LPC9_9RHOB|nr:hypothetical protein [Thalassovita mangrovi]MYM56886.1 hypothetical protein [Thalassovita mangrovi]
MSDLLTWTFIAAAPFWIVFVVGVIRYSSFFPAQILCPHQLRTAAGQTNLDNGMFDFCTVSKNLG